MQKEHAYQWSKTRMGGWVVAQIPILITTVTLESWCKRGYEASDASEQVILTYYDKIALHLNEPLYTRPCEKWCERLSDRLLPFGSLLDRLLPMFIF